MTTEEEEQQSSLHTWIDSILKLVQLLVLLGSIPLSIFLYFKYEKLQTELSLQQLTVQREISGINLKKKKSLRIKVEDDFEALQVKNYDDGTMLFAVDLEFDLTNISDKSMIVPFHVLEIYTGNISVTEEKRLMVLVMNEPGFDVSKVEEGQVITWTLARREINRIDEETEVPKYSDKVPEIINSGGWGAGYAAPGEEIGGGQRFLVRAKPGEYIGYILTITYKEKDDESKTYNMSDFASLKELSVLQKGK